MHFSDTVDSDGLAFDYQLRKGAAQLLERLIALLELCGDLAQRIVERALACVRLALAGTSGGLVSLGILKTAGARAPASQSSDVVDAVSAVKRKRIHPTPSDANTAVRRQRSADEISVGAGKVGEMPRSTARSRGN